MSASNTDKLRKGYFGSSTTLSAAIGSNDTTIPIADTTGWPTDTAIDITVDRVDANGNKTPSARETITVVISGTNGTQAIRGVEGNLQSHAAGAVVEITFTAATHNSSIDWGLQEHNQDGTHKNINALSVTATTGTFTNLTITGSNSTAGWSPVGQTLTYAGNNGNKEYLINTSVDLTGTFSKGMKVSVQRGTTPPTQCMSFTAASSQYATKASPTGITFTSAFTCEAWVYLNSYPSGFGDIIARTDNSTGGFFLRVTSSGQLSVEYGTGSAFTQWSTYQSLPLKRWVHVAGVVSSTSSKTLQGLYINGTSVPTTQTQSGAAGLAQVGNLSLGCSGSSASNFFDGYISEARVWSVAQSQANIQANMAISLTGSETNLVALFQGNGNFNDKTSNGNNLTATNGAIATQAANPYNAVEYGFITKVTSSQLTVFAGTDCNIPNMTLTSPQYSTSRAPYGFPTGREKWIVDALNYADSTFAVGSSTSTYYSFPAFTLTVPTGEWKLVEDIKNFSWTGTVSATMLGRSVVSTESVSVGAAFTDTSKWVMGTATRHGGNGSSGEFDTTITSSVDLSLTTPTTYYMGFRSEAAGGSYGQRHLGLTNTGGLSRFYAECAYI